jgi:hypothetical protein
VKQAWLWSRIVATEYDELPRPTAEAGSVAQVDVVPVDGSLRGGGLRAAARSSGSPSARRRS